MTPLIYALFPLAMAVIAILFPYKKPENFAPPSYEVMGKITAWGRISGWIMLLTTLLLLYLTGIQLYNFKQQFIPQRNGSVYKALPEQMYWFMIGFIFILGINCYIFLLLSKLYLGGDFRAYIDYSNSKSKYNTYKAVQPIAAFFSALGLVLLFCLWNYGIYICQDKMVVRWFLSTSDKTYSYGQVKSVNFVREQNKYAAHCVVVFKDGQDWNTSAGLPDDAKDEMIRYISKQSGMRVDTLDTDPQ
jgi:hypothetical protein